jgi:Outer membrane protein beta-barrel domain
MKQYLHASTRKCWALAFIILSASLPSFSQSGDNSSYWEAGITLGPGNFLGDLGGTQGKGTTFLKDNNFPMTKLMFGAFAGYHPNQLIGFRLALNFGTLEGDDAIIKGKGGFEEARKIRNSNFRSRLTEAMFLVEVYPTIFLENDPSDTWLKLRPYITIGGEVFKFKPQGTDPATGNWVDLQPLHTEGQGFPEYPDRKEYKLTQLAIPMGFGAKYFISETVDLSLEILHRKTFTDYIDDVSTNYVDPAAFYANLPLAQAKVAERLANKSGGTSGSGTRFLPGSKRGTPTNNDAFYTINFKLGLHLGNNDRWGNSTRCPIRF